MNRKRRGRGEGGVFQRSDGRWVGVISLGYDGTGKRKRRTVYGESKGDVQEKLRRLQTDASTGRLDDAGGMTVGTWLDRWLDTARSRLQPKTHLRYEQLVRLRIVPVLGSVKLAKLAPVHVQQLFTVLEREKVSARGRQMAGRVLHKSLRDAVRLRLIASNPAADVRSPTLRSRR
jgi:hypothetical protein